MAMAFRKVCIYSFLQTMAFSVEMELLSGLVETLETFWMECLASLSFKLPQEFRSGAYAQGC